jgi:hypothetical protein
MSTERRQVLDMLTQGKITADDADRLLDKLAAPAPPPPPALARRPSSSGAPKFLRVVVDESAGDKVNIRIPLALVRTGIKLTAMMPKEAGAKLEAQGFDLSRLGGLEGDELIEALSDITVDVEEANGDIVRVFCE